MADLTAFSLPSALRADYDALATKIAPYQWVGAFMQTYFCIVHNVWQLFGAKIDARIDGPGANVLREYNTMVTASGNWAAFNTNLTNWWNAWNTVYWNDITEGLAEKGPDVLFALIAGVWNGFQGMDKPQWVKTLEADIDALEVFNGKIPVWVQNPALTTTDVYNQGIPADSARAVGAVRTAIGPSLTLDPWWEVMWQAKIGSITQAERDKLLGTGPQLSGDQATVLKGIANHVLGLGWTGEGIANLWTAQAQAIVIHLANLLGHMDHATAEAIQSGVGPEFDAWISLVAKIGGVLAPPPLPEGLEPLPQV